MIMNHHSIIKPNRLSKGNKLGIVTLSAPEAAENPERVEQGIRTLQQLGFEVVLSPHALAMERGHLADDPLLLAEDVNAMFADPTINGIICSGGGTNANRLLPLVDYSLISQNPKVFVGMSNPTVILNAIFAKTGLVTFHGPVLVWNFGAEKMPEYSLKSFEQTTMNNEPIGPIPISGDWEFLKPGFAIGRLIGGNLWSLQSLIGTEFEPNWNGAILFWEDIAKEPKRLDAMLTHFLLAGVFDKISGMIIGELVLCDAKGGSLSLKDIIIDLLQGYDFPVLAGVRFGHTDEKLTIPIGALAHIDSQEDSFEILDNAVI